MNLRSASQRPCTPSESRSIGNDAAVMAMVKMAISTVKANGRKIGICGQATSDYRPIRLLSSRARHR